jgi:DNA-binding transcriptional LysR family regulator
MTIPDFQHLAVFQQVARLGSMSKAAAALRLAQPTISTRISDLEVELGVVLFRRTARGTELTDAGRHFLSYAERCLALYKEGGKHARSEAARREVRLAAPASLAEALFPTLAPMLVEQGFDVALSANHSPQVLEMLLDGRIDAGLCGAGPTMPSVVAVALPAVAVVCVARADDPLARQRAGSCGLADVATRLAVFEWDDQVDDLLERIRFAAGANPISGFIKVSPAEVARRLVIDRGAIAFLPRTTVATDLETGELVTLQVTGTPEYRWELMLVHRDRQGEDPGVRAVFESTARFLRNG